MSVFTGTYLNGIILDTNPSTVTASGYVTNHATTNNGDAVYGSSASAWTVTDYGTVEAKQASADGIHLGAGGTVSNHGTIAAVGANRVGVFVQQPGGYVGSGAGFVTNSGTIAAAGTNSIGVFVGAGP